jgi:hypothetical protein
MKVAYVTMGPGRSLEKLRRQTEGRSGATQRLPTLEEWSSRFDWAATARAWDDQQAAAAARDAAYQYRRDLEDHRKRYGDAGKNLYKVAVGLMNTIAAQLQGQVIEGKDGKRYTIPAMKIDQGAITILARTMTIAADLEAHALRLGDILPKLDQDGSDS